MSGKKTTDGSRLNRAGRIVLIMHNFPDDTPFLLNKLLGLQQEGLDVHVMFRNHGGRSDAMRHPTVPALTRGTLHWAWPTVRAYLPVLYPLLLLRCLWRNPGATLRFWHRAVRERDVDMVARFYIEGPVIALKPDLVHFEFGTLAAEGIHVRDVLDCQVVVSFRGYDLNFVKLNDPRYYSSVWTKASYLHLLGEDLWKRAIMRGCPPDKPHVFIPPAIDTDTFSHGDRAHTEEAGAAERPLRVLSVGRLVWKKGYEYALEAIRLLERRNVICEYRIVGDGEYVDAIAFAAHEMGLADRVRFLGRLTPEGVRRQMIWADVMLHAAVSEGFCNAVVEAQAMQLPVVCTDADGLRENVSDGISGFVVPRRNAEALAERLLLLADQPALRRKMADAGRKRAVENFQLVEQIAAFRDLYVHLLNGVEMSLPGKSATLSNES